MIYTGFLLGLAGSFHCLGMCGPIVLAMQWPKSSPASKAVGLLIYHLGRISSYVAIGGAAGLLGQALLFTGFQTYLAYISGSLMIVLGLFAANLDALLFKLPAFRKFYEAVANRLGRLLAHRKGIWLAGFLNGFLPCGLVYMALFGALSMGNGLQGMAYMAVFGMGTLPLMLAGGMAGHLVLARWRGLVRKAYPVLFIAVGLLIVYRGTTIAQVQGRDTQEAIICK